MPNTIPFAQKNRIQDVKKVVDRIKLDDCFQVKRIFVKSGVAISLQNNKYCSEHWIVVEGIAKVIIDDEIKLVNVGHSVYVPNGFHRGSNRKLPR
jgi:mannose-1-phosphate guanylyltransferase/mannose-6-phosphate isomerase